MRLTIAYSKIKKRNLVWINNDTHQRETLSERPIRPPLRLEIESKTKSLTSVSKTNQSWSRDLQHWKTFKLFLPAACSTIKPLSPAPVTWPRHILMLQKQDKDFFLLKRTTFIKSIESNKPVNDRWTIGGEVGAEASLKSPEWQRNTLKIRCQYT